MQLTRGMDKTVTALVGELKALSTEVADDKDLANVAAVSAGVCVRADALAGVCRSSGLASSVRRCWWDDSRGRVLW